MDNQLPSVKKKTFWRRPEGKLGVFFLIAGAAVVAIYHVPIFNFITSLLKGTTVCLKTSESYKYFSNIRSFKRL